VEPLWLGMGRKELGVEKAKAETDLKRGGFLYYAEQTREDNVNVKVTTEPRLPANRDHFASRTGKKTSSRGLTDTVPSLKDAEDQTFGAGRE